MTIEQMRYTVIDKLQEIENPDVLDAIYKILNNLSKKEVQLKLSDEQKRMMELSEHDIAAGRIYTDTQVNSEEDKWLEE